MWRKPFGVRKMNFPHWRGEGEAWWSLFERGLKSQNQEPFIPYFVESTSIFQLYITIVLIPNHTKINMQYTVQYGKHMDAHLRFLFQLLVTHLSDNQTGKFENCAGDVHFIWGCALQGFLLQPNPRNLARC